MPRVFHFGPLKNDRKFLISRYATVRDADADFYGTYDALFLARKAQVLYGMYQHAESVLSAVRGRGATLDGSEEDLQTFLATELHCTAYHQTEALIALLLAEYQNLPDWVYLTSYGNSEIKEAAKGIAKRYSNIPGTSVANLGQLVQQAVFANRDFSNTTFAPQWEESLESIEALLQIVSEQFVDGHEYNSYKHGLRVVLGSAAFGIVPGELKQENVRTLAVMPHSMTFLQIEKLGADYGAHMVTKEVKPDYSFKVVQCMGSLLTTIKDFRIARLRGSLAPELSLPVYDTIQLDRIKPATKFGFSY